MCLNCNCFGGRTGIVSGNSYILVFIILFIFGGSTGIILGNNVIDLTIHDNYYVIGHFHIVLSVGTVLVIIIGLIG